MDIGEKGVLYDLLCKIDEASSKANFRSKRSPNETTSFQDGFNHGEAQGIARMKTLVQQSLAKLNLSKAQLWHDITLQDEH